MRNEGDKGALARGAIAAAVAAAIGVVAEPSFAASCGGRRVCACGDKVVEDYRLPGDLGPCPKDGLRVDGRVVLDGAGHTIRGSGPHGAGIRVGEGAAGAHVQNVVVRGFLHGVRLVAARGARLTAVEAVGNGDPGEGEGYGIDVSGGASDNVLERLRVHENADEGIHVGTDAAGNRISDSDVFANGRENVYFLACRDNRLERSRVRAPGSGHAAVYVKFATGTVLEGNQVEGGPIQLRGGTRETEMLDNALRDASVVLEEQRDRRFGFGAPSATLLRGGSITASDACVRLDGGIGTRIEAVALQCPGGIRVARGTRVAVSDLAPIEGRSPVRCAGGEECVLGAAPEPAPVKSKKRRKAS